MHTLCIIHGDATLDMIERKKNGTRSVYHPQWTGSRDFDSSNFGKVDNVNSIFLKRVGVGAYITKIKALPPI